MKTIVWLKMICLLLVATPPTLLADESETVTVEFSGSSPLAPNSHAVDPRYLVAGSDGQEYVTNFTCVHPDKDSSGRGHGSIFIFDPEWPHHVRYTACFGASQEGFEQCQAYKKRIQTEKDDTIALSWVDEGRETNVTGKIIDENGEEADLPLVHSLDCF